MDVQNTSTESLPITSSITSPPTEEQLAIEFTTAHSSLDSFIVPVDQLLHQHDEPVAVPGSPISLKAETMAYYFA